MDSLLSAHIRWTLCSRLVVIRLALFYFQLPLKPFFVLADDIRVYVFIQLLFGNFLFLSANRIYFLRITFGSSGF